MQHEQPRICEARRHKGREALHQLPRAAKIRLLEAHTALLRKNMLIIERTRSLKRRLAGKETARTVGGIDQLLRDLLGVKLARSVDEHGGNAAAHGVRLGAQAAQEAQRLPVHAALVDGGGQQNAPIP